jgi:hypothetical protein
MFRIMRKYDSGSSVVNIRLYDYFFIITCSFCIQNLGHLKECKPYIRFFFATASGPAPIQWVSGEFTPGVNRPGHEAERLPLSSAEVKNS